MEFEKKGYRSQRSYKRGKSKWSLNITRTLPTANMHSRFCGCRRSSFGEFWVNPTSLNFWSLKRGLIRGVKSKWSKNLPPVPTTCTANFMHLGAAVCEHRMHGLSREVVSSQRGRSREVSGLQNNDDLTHPRRCLPSFVDVDLETVKLCDGNRTATNPHTHIYRSLQHYNIDD